MSARFGVRRQERGRCAAPRSPQAEAAAAELPTSHHAVSLSEDIHGRLRLFTRRSAAGTRK